MEPKVSIIIPVYNVEPFLSKFYEILSVRLTLSAFFALKNGLPRESGRPSIFVQFAQNQTTPCASIASATLRKPAIFAPAT